MSTYSAQLPGGLWTTTTTTQNVGTLTPQKIPDMPEALSQFDPNEILKAAAAIQSSPINYPISVMESVMAKNGTLKDWEVAQLEAVFRKFLAKYNSPLAKALK